MNPCQMLVMVHATWSLHQVGTSDGRQTSMTRKLWGTGVHILQHAAVVIAGVILIVLGMAMTFSLVFVVPGLFVLAIGVAVVVGAMFAHSVAGP